MISYNEALAKARALKPNIDACDEYNDAYVFKTRADYDTIGGDSPCVILNRVTCVKKLQKHKIFNQDRVTCAKKLQKHNKDTE